ncbi:LLM class flavin-dependent oxidoreductase [Novosphingobium sp. G106]|uniref:LLM class flavin-dependent oxidoreductase n=1 Tax=Novosphingobium sp. G106 TaxID=2849500 RepID=UPI001C2D4FC0|nr:LLM class flavin-dependent oxidoreductase [Novosphingobium sp. G106]MBV1690933.1 LLM class flavin-dependent oxidoreductase [Novosphingobium sp. G106]
MSKLTFGFLYDFRNPPQWRKPWEAFYAETLDVIAETERLGFGAAYVPEHHLAEDGYLPSPLTLLAAIAARTKTMRLGTGVALAPLYEPVRFAQDAAMIDILSGGRLDLGLAIGYRKRETAAFGVDFTRRGARFDEFLQIVTRLWAGETVDFEGKHFSIKGARLSPPAPRGRVPLYIGGFSDKAIDRVARFGDGYVGNPEIWDLYSAKLAERGRDPTTVGIRIPGLTSFIARDPAAALDELAPYFLHVNNTYAEFFAEDQALGMGGMKPKTLKEYKASGELKIMTPDEAITYLKGLQEKMPLEHYLLGMPPGLPTERFLHYAGHIAQDVLPAFA